MNNIKMFYNRPFIKLIFDMAEDLCKAFDPINSLDDETRTSSHSFINQQIKENPDLYHVLFDIFNWA